MGAQLAAFELRKILSIYQEGHYWHCVLAHSAFSILARQKLHGDAGVL